MKKIRILIANDNRDSVYMIKELLEGFDEFKVIGEVFNGKDALDFALNYEPDIIIMDTDMPMMDGFTASQSITKMIPYIGIILVGTMESIDIIKRTMKVGAGDFLELPLTIQKIKNAIFQLYESKYEQKKYIIENSYMMPKMISRIVSVFSSKGGVGKSVIAVNSTISIFYGCFRMVIFITNNYLFIVIKSINY